MIYFLTLLMAFPKLGSESVYLYTKQNETAELKLSLLEFNTTDDSFLFRSTLNNAPLDQAWVRSDDFWSQDEFLVFQKSCNKEVVTVPAGTFEACKIIAPPQTFWFADVPFLLVKEVSIEEGLEVKRELTSFTP